MGELRIEMAEDRPHVWIERRGDMLHCGDENGDFAAATDLRALMGYVALLIYDNGTIRDGPLPDVETEPADQQPNGGTDEHNRSPR